MLVEEADELFDDMGARARKVRKGLRDARFRREWKDKVLF